jgi:ABC-type antimicrobial peptide transport system permease subunit
VLEDGVTPVVIGTILGVGISAFAARAMAGMLYGVGSFDISIACAAVGILLIIGGLASLLPARRATRINPVQALRAE